MNYNHNLSNVLMDAGTIGFKNLDGKELEQRELWEFCIDLQLIKIKPIENTRHCEVRPRSSCEAKQS